MNGHGKWGAPQRGPGSGAQGDRSLPMQGGGGFDGGDATALAKVLEQVDFGNPAPDMFDGVAQRVAGLLSGDKNKSSQMRRFYDEIIRHADRHRGSGNDADDAARFVRDLPFIRMICAHAAYAQTRGHVDANFVAFMQTCLRRVETAEHLRLFRMFFEAVIGFSPKTN